MIVLNQEHGDEKASSAANFDDFTVASFRNGLVFAGDDFGGCGDGAGVAGADSTIGLLGTCGAVVGEMLDKGALTTPMLRFICISNSPTYQNKSRLRS
ncbi:hypothetical protein Ahy_A07g031790 isoform B [Arachis hypogaea]|uniref:Uncharacterized protein n=1 Tax=Arachis hypogaea TaxID=3818 RepID=A0A445C527_ARAHY|nr:hypothetical protein Ahy_A07g031790 isoform B [Arachis hypogaea]